MVRLADLPEHEREHHLARIPLMPTFPKVALVPGVALSKRRVALITTAGLHLRGEKPYNGSASGYEYRVIPAETPEKDLVMSHASVNFDRTGFLADVNVVFPLDRLKELVLKKVVGSVARFHYSFMGATWPVTNYENTVRALATLLKQDKVDAVFLSPV
jgi:D-proline reductase (dithiol) PrdB